MNWNFVWERPTVDYLGDERITVIALRDFADYATAEVIAVLAFVAISLVVDELIAGAELTLVATWVVIYGERYVIVFTLDVDSLS